MLLAYDFVDLLQEIAFVFLDVHLALGEYLAHELGQVLEVVDAVLGTLLDLVVQVPEVAVEVIDFEQVLVDQLLFGLEHVSATEV